MRFSVLLLVIVALPLVSIEMAFSKTCTAQASSSLAACNTSNANKPAPKRLDCPTLTQARLQACLQTGNWATSGQRSEIFEKR